MPAAAGIDDVKAQLGRTLPEHGSPPEEVVDRLAAAVEPGLMASPSGRFYGWVMGATLPAALGADWLVSAWDQNSGMRDATPGTVAAEELAARWLVELLDLPEGSGVGFTTGATMANFTCLNAARSEVLARVGWDVAEQGLAGGPRVRVLVGAERHSSIDLALRYLGLGAPEVVACDAEGRIDVADLDFRLAEDGGPAILCLQAGNIHSGAFDPFAEAVEVAHEAGAWVHVDGAFGLWAGASPTYRHLVDGVAGADSWATDAHKTLNVPYDSGLAIVREPAALRASMGMHGEYLIHDELGEPLDKVPEISRRGRALPVWAVLRALGRSGVAELVDRLCGHARAFAEGAAGIPGAEVLNDVVFTQVCVSFGDDDRTRRVLDAMMADGTAWMTGSRWPGRAELRISVSNWSTTEDAVRRSLDALRRAAAGA